MGEWATDKIAELEESLENARKELDEATTRAEEADDDLDRALGEDLKPGETPVDAIGRLRRERDEALARLKPSGQVAEDEAALLDVLKRRAYGDECAPSQDRVRRLAAQAQGYEAAVVDNAAWRVAALEVAPAIAVLARAPEVAKDIRHVLLDAEAAFLANARNPRPGAALLEQHRKEVAQARNEGLEEAAKQAEQAEAKTTGMRVGLHIVAGRIRAMKTCTDGSCAKCRSGKPCR